MSILARRGIRHRTATSAVMTDTTNVSFTSPANGLTSTYHRYASGLSPNKPLGLLIQLHGDAAFEYLNPTSTYSLGGTEGITAQARHRNMICVPVKAPDTTGEITWWEAGPANSVYLRDLIRQLFVLYPNINRNRVWLVGYSGGAQQIAQFFMPLQSATLFGGGAMIYGGGGPPSSADTPVTPLPYASTLRAQFPMKWYTGADDDGSTSSDGYDALADAQAGRSYYQTAGFTTTIESPAGVAHDLDGTFGPTLGRYLHTADAPAVATTTSAVRTSSGMTWTGTVTNAPAVTLRGSASAFGTQEGFWEIGAVNLTTRQVTVTITEFTPGTPYNWRLELGGGTTHGTLLTSGSVPGTP